ncbi:uncharacterized protein Eint_030080 [Encephalitozoon intestinalis ATCC 50506]|uniref:Uncharacterized protein n=1 Tax=Encephalitozoon intestinalis (strain ATCC 50506) TaxID=876142 RepID=E0S619_ENCIT|nr:uncharacterized protein Eint_030080 [Encephalitozoon intestinalis ATCC 50506]ADM11154.1 hypothetical protein Eint_030080 [Encephalitozoon intestinalis ATCC 50506]UTX44819.1 hypothetical protein GPK93_03g03440 [Encephalitozoon intestinalis]
MRKTYESTSRLSKKMKSYKKRILDPGTKLDVVKDDDNLENIDDYWRTAESVLKDDTTIEVDETSVYKSDTGGEDENEEPNAQSDTLFDIKTIRESLSAKNRDVFLSSSRESLETNSILENKRLSSSFERIEDKPEGQPKSPEDGKEFSGEFYTEISSRGEELNEYDDDRCSPNEMGKDQGISPAKEMKDRYRKRLQSLGKGVEKSTARKSIIEPKEIYEYKGETIYNSEGKKVAVTNISALYRGRSAFEPLVASTMLETAILFLNNLAFIKPEKAVCNFSIFMIKGTVCIEMGHDKVILKRGSICIIEKGDVYSISNSFGTRCTILLTYSIV